MRAFLARHSISVFVALVLLGSPLGYVSSRAELGGDESLLSRILGWPAQTSPLLAALLLTWAADGFSGVRRLLTGLFVWRVRLRWYAVALFLYPFLSVVSIVALFTFRGELPPVHAADIRWGLLRWNVGFYLGPMLLYTTLYEEVGWRGFLQPRLQRRYSPLLSALFVAIVWSLWHGWRLVDGLDDPLSHVRFLLHCIVHSVVFAWLLNGARRSLLLVGLAHFSVNFALFLRNFFILPPGDWEAVLQIYSGLLALVGVALVIAGGESLRIDRKTGPSGRPT